ncbi:MAG: DegT/DnrJ/EryC1/StrS family aminotransferase [Pseudodesulfovibrio sp.]|nr:DegT/DnrJ/EryC1/StrS family aminotransferase [Pseudodesulfovibrio sp.]
MMPIAKPFLGEEEARAASEAILSGWVTQGPRVKEFEDRFASYVGADCACAVSSCTTALHLALYALGIKAGDEVITVSHSYIATANSVRYCGAIPVFVDIDPDTYNMDPLLLEAAITPKTKAILCVHQVGMPCDMPALLEIARKHDLKVVEDAACCAGSEIMIDGQWEKIGRPHGDIACFSFHPRKVITTGDGGMLTTNNIELDATFRLLRQHAMSVPDTVRHSAREVIFEEYPVLGFNYRMTDIQGGIGIEQLKRLDSLIEERRKLAALYTELLQDLPVVTPLEPEWCRSNWQSYQIMCPGVAQKPLMQGMQDVGIATRRGIMCAHREKAYAGSEICRVPAAGLPVSEQTQDHGLILPLFPGMSEADVHQVVQELAKLLV